jgi:hypothetical protein
MVRVVARWGTSGCCRPTNVSVWSVGDRCPAARFSCDADDRTEPPFRLAVRHGSYAGSLTLGKSCENPVGRSDRGHRGGARAGPGVTYRGPAAGTGREGDQHGAGAPAGRRIRRGRGARRRAAATAASCAARSSLRARAPPRQPTVRRSSSCALPVPPHDGELQAPNAMARGVAFRSERA